VQIDEPYLQARPEQAREYALEAIDRALDGIDGETVVHTCFGYAHIVHDRSDGYPFLRELHDCAATHVSLEAAQPDLDPEVLRAVGARRSCSACSTSARPRRRPRSWWRSGSAGARGRPAERARRRADCGMKYLPRDLAFRKLEAMVAGAHIVRAELG
jgi:5-methyltetrahydropteroyltriglutamate--homocysteine methyltransferase